MNSASFLKQSINTLAFLIASISCSAQSDSLNFNDLLYSKTHISISLNPNYTFKSKAKLTSGTQNLTPNNLVGFEGGVDFIFNPEQNIGIKTGLHFGALPFDWGYNLNAYYDSIYGYHIQESPKDWALFAREYFGYVSVPIQLEWRTPLNRKTYFTATGGLNLRKSFQQFGGIGFSAYDQKNDTNYDLLDINISGDKKPFRANFALGAGLSFVLKNHDLFFINATANISNRDLITGNFIFYTPTGVASTGTYNKTGSSVGLEFGYRFTKEKKAARMTSMPAYEYSKHRGQLNTKLTSNNLDYIFSRNQLEINIGTLFNLKPTVTATTGDKPDAKGGRAPYLQLAYTFNKNKNWGFKTGVALGGIGYKYNDVILYDSAFMMGFSNDFSNEFGFIGLSENVEYRHPIKENILLYGNAGINVSTLLTGQYYYSYSYSVANYYPDNSISGKTTDNFLLSANLGTGLLFACRNYNLWRIGVNYNHSFSTVATENYLFNKGYVNEQTGSTKTNGSYIAATIGYVYSFAPSPYAVAKHRLKRDTDTKVRKPKITSADLDSIYTKNQFAITSELNFMMRPEVTIAQGSPLDIYTYPKFGFSAHYIFNFNKRWAVKGGLNYGGYSYDTDTYYYNNIDSSRFYYYSTNIVNTVGVTASAEYRKQISHNNLWYADAGLSLKKYFNTGESSLLLFDSTYSGGIISSLNSDGFIAGANFETGFLFTAKNYNQWKFGITYFQSFTTLLTQDYSFTNPITNQINQGTVAASGSYFGINAGYVFSFKKKEKQ